MTSYKYLLRSFGYDYSICSIQMIGLLISDAFIVQNQVLFCVNFGYKYLNEILIQEILGGTHDDLFEVCDINEV